MSVLFMMAARNAERTVGAAIASVQAQSHADWRLAVVDDGSTDGTGRILAEFATRDPRIQVLRNERQSGLSAALNRVWRSRDAAYYARIDADDACLPDRLTTQLTFLNEHPEVDVLGGGALLIDDEGREVGRLLRCEQHADLMRRLLRETPFIHPTVVMRRRFLVGTGGYDESFPRSQDHELWLRGSGDFRYHNLRIPLIRYRVRAVPSWSTIYWGTRTICRAVGRQRLGIAGYWYPLRYLLGTTLVRCRLRTNSLLRAS